jgi:hypothetical protein
MFGAVYGAVVAPTDYQPTDRPCEDCGAVVVAGLEPLTASDDPELTATGVSAVGSEWCTNLDCRSNHAVPGLWRIGVNDYTCKVCGEALRTPMSEVVAHRRTH